MSKKEKTKILLKRDAFKRLAEHRTERAIHYIDLIGNLSNKRAYEYEIEDINKIINALRSSISLTKSKFDGNIQKQKFTLDEEANDDK